MGMARPSINFQFSKHLPTQTGLRKHPPDGHADHFGGFLGQEFLCAHLLNPTWVTGVMIVYLVFQLPSGQTHLSCVDHHNKISRIHMRRVGGFMLSPQYPSHSNSEPPQYLALCVYKIPVVIHFFFLCLVGLHLIPFKKYFQRYNSSPDQEVLFTSSSFFPKHASPIREPPGWQYRPWNRFLKSIQR